jgi:hypothetical protein
VLADLLRAAARLFSFPGVQHLQNIHPLVVHFPIALLFATALIYWVGFLARRESWQWSGLCTLVLGALGASVAAAGLYAAPGDACSVIKTAAGVSQTMIAVAILSVTLALWAIAARPMPERGRGAFLRSCCWWRRLSPRVPITAGGWFTTIMPAATRAASH